MGRIARKIRRELERALRQKTASFEAFRRGKERAETCFPILGVRAPAAVTVRIALQQGRRRPEAEENL